MRFEWDPKKAKRNPRKQAVSFDEAVTVFYDSLSATFDDPDRSVGKHGYITIGFFSRDRLFVVGYTKRGKALRIINERPATAHERK